MSSYILRTVRPSDLQNWIKTNAVGSLKATARESWMAYLQANSGTGKTLHDLEATFLTGQAVSGSNNKEKWRAFLAGQSGAKTSEKARNKYK